MSLSIDISVVIPLYNKKDTIARALESVKCQTVQPREIIVVDDGSTDGSSEVVESLGIRGLRLIHQENAGVSAARNKGVREAVSEWIAFLDADDEWMPDFLESINILYQKFPYCNVLATAYLYKDGRSESFPKIKYSSDVGVLDRYFKIASSGSPPLWTGAVVVKKIIIHEVGFFCEEIKIGEDLLMWAKLAHTYNIAYLNKPKSIYYFPLEINYSDSFRFPDKNDMVYDELMLMLKSVSSLQKKQDVKRYVGCWCKIRLHLFAFYGNKAEVCHEFIKMLRVGYVNYKSFILLIVVFAPLEFRNYIFSSRFNKMR